MNNIEQFIDELLQEAGLTNLSAEDRREYVKKLSREAEVRLGLMALRNLNDDALKDFYELITQESVDRQELLKFFRNNISDFDQRAADALREFAVEFLDSVQKLRVAV